MEWAVKAWTSSRARAGVFHLGGCPNSMKTETLSLLLSTRKGLPVFVFPDLLPSLLSPDSNLFQFSILHFLEGPTPKTISCVGGLHQMLGFNEYGLVAIPRDSIQCLPESDSTNKVGASFETPYGCRLAGGAVSGSISVGLTLKNGSNMLKRRHEECFRLLDWRPRAWRDHG